MNEREGGYYWVKDGGKWEVLWFNGLMWDGQVWDEDLQEVGQRIPSPEEGMVSVPRELIEEMASDIEAEVTHRYVHNGEIHPAEQRKYDMDMEIVQRARQALERKEG